MVVLLVRSVPRGLRGELTRWLLEPRAGVFVGDVSALVRDKLWEKVCAECKEGEAILVHNTDNEQGFALRFWHVQDKEVVDYEGLWLIRTVA